MAKGAECQHLPSSPGSGVCEAGLRDASSPAACPPLLSARLPSALRGASCHPAETRLRKAGLPGKQLTSHTVPWELATACCSRQLILVNRASLGRRPSNTASLPSLRAEAAKPANSLPGHTAATTRFGLRPVTHSKGVGVGRGLLALPPTINAEFQACS